MKKLKLSDIKFSITPEQEEMSVRGNAVVTGDDQEDKRIEDEILEKLEGNIWAWCTVVVEGKYKSLSATAYLGGCSYEDEKDFINGGYYNGMQEEVMNDLQQQLDDLLKED